MRCCLEWSASPLRAAPQRPTRRTPRTRPLTPPARRPPPGRLLRRPEQRYATHIPLNSLQKGAVGLLSLLGAFNDPRRGDLVAAAGETTGLLPLMAMRDRMQRTETGRLILAEKPRVTVRRPPGVGGGGGWVGACWRGVSGRLATALAGESSCVGRRTEECALCRGA